MRNARSQRYMAVEHLIKDMVYSTLGYAKITLCDIKLVDGGVVRGHAIRNPKDKYDLGLACEIAQGRALKKLHLKYTASLVRSEQLKATEEDRNKYRVK